MAVGEGVRCCSHAATSVERAKVYKRGMPGKEKLKKICDTGLDKHEDEEKTLAQDELEIVNRVAVVETCVVESAGARGCCPSFNPGMRCWHEPVQLSNLCYLVTSAHAFYAGVYDVAVLSIAVTFASYLYHLHCERCYLLLDASFAGCVFMMAILCLLDAVTQSGPFHWMVLGSGIIFPLLMFLFIKSDLPTTPDYEWYHTWWHVVTAGSSSFVVFYLEMETVSKTSFELFTWTALCAGVGIAFACLFVMRDIIEKTFFTYIRKALAERNMASKDDEKIKITEDNEIIVPLGKGWGECHISPSWFWFGLGLQTVGVCTIYSTGTKQLSLLLLGASVCSSLYHHLHDRCQAYLDLTISSVAAVAAASAFLHVTGHSHIAEWLVLFALASLPILLLWSTGKLEGLFNEDVSRLRKLTKGQRRTRAIVRRRSMKKMIPTSHGSCSSSSCVCHNQLYHYRFSHSVLTVFNLSAAGLCLIASIS